MMQTANHEIKFENVDWAARNRDAKQSKKDKKRSLTPTKEKDFEHVETISLTPPMMQAPAPSQPKPAYHSPPRLNLQSPPQYQGAPGGGLNIQYPDEKREMVSLIHPSLCQKLTICRTRRVHGNQLTHLHLTMFPTRNSRMSSSTKIVEIGNHNALSQTSTMSHLRTIKMSPAAHGPAGSG